MGSVFLPLFGYGTLKITYSNNIYKSDVSKIFLYSKSYTYSIQIGNASFAGLGENIKHRYLERIQLLIFPFM